jgi:phosphopantetheinyl transferase
MMMQVLVIARVKPGLEIEKVLPFVSKEAAQAWEFYASEQIRQMYYIADMSGAVMFWEGENVESVAQEVNKLPMVKEEILACEILPLKPYTGYGSLFAQQ